MSLRSAWKAVTGRKTRKYNRLSDIDQSISKLDPDEISKQILKDPSLTPRRKRKLQNLLDMREHGKKYGLTGKKVKENAEKLAKRMMREEEEIDKEADLIIRQINEEAAMDLYKKLPAVPRGSVMITGKRSSSKSMSKRAGGKSRTNRRR
jgi:uncharacterized FlaG/YvyC family protein